MAVAQQAGVRELLDIAAAAPHLHRVAGDAPGVAAGAELDQRRQDAQQGVGAVVAGVGAAQRLGGQEHHAARLLGRNDDLGQLPAHQRHVDQALTEGAAAVRDEQRLGGGAAHHAGGPHAVRQARVVDHVGHLPEAVAGRADHPGDGAQKRDLARGHRLGAELVLQPDDAEGVAAAVRQVPRQQEERHALQPVRRARRPRKHHGEVGVGVRAEPLFAGQPPRAVRAGVRPDRR